MSDSVEAKRAKLAELLARKARPQAAGGSAPLSLQQEGLWFVHQLDPLDASWNVVGSLRIEGSLNEAALWKSLELIVERHEALRTRFAVEDGAPVQRISETAPLTRLPLVDLSAVPPERRHAEAERALGQAAGRPFDVAEGPLVRAQLARMGPDDHLFCLVLHHLVSDAWTQAVIIRELSQLYPRVAAGQPPELPPLRHQYRDFVRWQRRQVEGEAYRSQLEYWRKQLAGAPALLPLPTDRPRPAQASHAAARLSATFPRATVEGLKRISRAEQATLFMTLLAAFDVLLARHSNSLDVVVGCPYANRDRVEDEALAGFFVNMLVYRTDLSGRPTFRELVQRVRRTSLEALEHSALPLSSVVKALGVQRDPSHSPLFQVMFELQNVPVMTEVAGLKLTPAQVSPAAVGYDLFLYTEERGGELYCFLDYVTALFDASTMQRLLESFGVLLEKIVENPDLPVDQLPLLSNAERHRQLAVRDAPPGDWPLTTVPALFVEQARKTPAAPAVRFEGRSHTYAELELQSRKLAHALRALGVGPGARVAVHMERCYELVVALLGVMRAGGAYVPLDPAFPKERLDAMREDSQPLLVLTLERVQELVRSGDDSPLTFQPGPEDLAYVIYTSGSTGRPKGVMNNHGPVCNRVQWQVAQYPLQPDDRVIQKTPYSFDVSVWELFWPLVTGAQLVVARPAGHLSPPYLVDLIEREGITQMHMVPSMLQVFLEEPALRTRCASMRRLFCTGEALTVSLVERVFERLGCELTNFYGPTEAAVEVTFWECERATTRSAIPIGHALPGARLYVLDAQLEPVPVGVTGELHIGGAPVGVGYLNRPDLTAEKFIPDPYDGTPGARLYKTGDLARYRRGGELEYLGRADRQVKVRGVRVELDEVEGALARHPGVRECVVLLRDSGKGQLLVGYVVAARDPAPSHAELREFLEQRLPAAMVPTQFMTLAALPLGPTGKTDRKALPEPSREKLPPRPPSSANEVTLARLWRELLPPVEFGVDDDFFALGGHSLMLIRMIPLIERALNIGVPLRVFYEARTVSALARWIDANPGGRTAAQEEADERLQIEADAQLDADIRPSGRVNPVVAPDATVFLTGATGFLGAFLLDELLRAKRRVLCLVRAKDEAEGLERLRANLKSYELPTQDLDRLVEVVIGDLKSPRFGLSEAGFSALSRRVGAVLHNGADVNLVVPYARVRESNVLGTVTALRLACLGEGRPFHHVSTLSVFFAPERDDQRLDEETRSEQHLPQAGYPRSKWVAERLVQEASARGLPVGIYRVGHVTGASKSGAWKHDDVAARFVLGCMMLEGVPDAHPPLHLTPADVLARWIVGLTLAPPSGRTVFHITNPHPPVPGEQVASWFRELGRGVQHVPYVEWMEKLKRSKDNPLFPMLPLFGDAGPWGARIAFSAEATARVCRALGMDFPESSREQLGNVVRWLEARE